MTIDFFVLLSIWNIYFGLYAADIAYCLYCCKVVAINQIKICFWITEREREGERGETDRDRDREIERQRDRETERQTVLKIAPFKYILAAFSK